jgi:hypothetical protein
MNEVQLVNTEFQERLRQTAQETETSVQQAAAEYLKTAVKEAERLTRSSVTEELQARFKKETAAAVEALRKELTAERTQLEKEFDRAKQAGKEELERVKQTAKEELDRAKQAAREELERVKKAAKEESDHAQQSVAAWDKERSQLLADRKRAGELLEQTKEEYDRELVEHGEAAAIALDRQIATAVERVRADMTIRWDGERTTLVAERDRAVKALADREAAHQKATTEFERASGDSSKKMQAAREEWEKEKNRLIEENQQAQELLSEASANIEQWRHAADAHQQSAASASAAGNNTAVVEAINAEVARVQSLIQGISKLIEDPNTELSVVIRKNAERAELESYLRGVRFNTPK